MVIQTGKSQMESRIKLLIFNLFRRIINTVYDLRLRPSIIYCLGERFRIRPVFVGIIP